MKLITTILALVAGVLLTGTACEIEEPAPVQGAEQPDGGEGSESPKKKAPIGLAAKRTQAKTSMLSTGDKLTCVRVTVSNRTDGNVEINPLYFSITASDGTKHDSSTALGEYEGQIETMDIAPGEKARGVVCVKGDFRPKTVSMTSPLFDTAARAQVAS